MPRKLVIILVILAVVAYAGWRFSPEIHDAMLAKSPPASTAEIVAALQKGALILDVRMARETRKEGAVLVPGATNISIFALKGQLDALPRDRPIITYCVSGGRAGKAAKILRENGFEAISGGGAKDLRAIVEGANSSSRP